MRRLAFFSQKGGSGKTTLAVHVAVAACDAGERVVIIDTDPQGSATVWGQAREQETPVIATAAPADLVAVIDAAQAEKMSLAIIDTAPHAAPAAARIMQQVDFVAIPVRPTAFDLAAVESAVNIVNAAKKRAAFVLSACPFRSPEIGETREALEGYGLSIFPGVITDRRPFYRAVTSGRAVTEFEAEGKAAAEIRELWDWINNAMTP